MSWNFWSWLSVAAIACWCGLLSILHVRARAAGATATSLSQSYRDLLRRLTSCEELQNECAQAISRIEARDKMRRVRAGISATGAETQTGLAPGDLNPTAPASRGSKLSNLSTAEIRRRIALREPLP